MTLQEIMALKKEYDEKISSEFKSVLIEEIGLVFNTVPELDKIRWTQYVPYFNDGDECVFGVNEFSFSFNQDLKEMELSWAGGWGNRAFEGFRTIQAFDFSDVPYWSDVPVPPESRGEADQVKELSDRLLGAINNLIQIKAQFAEEFKLMFGAHAEVTVTRGNPNFDVEEYVDHE